MRTELIEKAKTILLDPKAPKNIKAQVYEILEKQRSKEANAGAKETIIGYAKHMYPGYNDPAHIKLIAKNLESLEKGDIDRLAIFMPPRHGKSMLCSEFFPAWYLGRNPKKFVIQSTYAQELADDFVIATGHQYTVREFIEHAAECLDFKIDWNGKLLYINKKILPLMFFLFIVPMAPFSQPSIVKNLQ